MPDRKSKQYWRDPEFWRLEIQAYLQNNPQFNTKQNQELLEKEFLTLLKSLRLRLRILLEFVLRQKTRQMLLLLYFYQKDWGLRLQVSIQY